MQIRFLILLLHMCGKLLNIVGKIMRLRIFPAQNLFFVMDIQKAQRAASAIGCSLFLVFASSPEGPINTRPKMNILENVPIAIRG